MHQKQKYAVWMAGLAILTVLSCLLALGMGQFHISPARVMQEIFRPSLSDGVRDNVRTTLFNIRIPRILMSLMAGAGLASSGAAFQSLFANPLATPDTLGVANGASFGAALALLLGAGAMEVKGLSLLCGLAAIVLVFAVTRGMGQRNPSMLMVILAGMVISSLFSALVSLIKYVADPQDVLPVITFWLMGRFSGITKSSMLFSAPLIGAGVLLIYLLRFRLNALSLSEDEAKAMGVNLRRVRALVILAAAVCTAAVVSVCGVIGWVGLLIPHISRMLFGSDNRYVVPSSILSGALFLLLADTAARCMNAAEIPVSILTAVIGAPVFILLLRKTGGLNG